MGTLSLATAANQRVSFGLPWGPAARLSVEAAGRRGAASRTRPWATEVRAAGLLLGGCGVCQVAVMCASAPDDLQHVQCVLVWDAHPC
jgi:hypothetical protein